MMAALRSDAFAAISVVEQVGTRQLIASRKLSAGQLQCRALSGRARSARGPRGTATLGLEQAQESLSRMAQCVRSKIAIKCAAGHYVGARERSRSAT